VFLTQTIVKKQIWSSAVPVSVPSIEQIKNIIGADHLGYISIDGLYRAIAQSKRDNANPQYCDACFSDDYPIRLTDKEGAEAPLLDYMKK
jgi:glutamine phosphoribosylpyrophosphate amidotransferase